MTTSDKHIHKILSKDPNLFFTMTGLPSEGEYSYKSVTIKEFSRTMDGLMEPQNPANTNWVVEFQNQWEAGIYPRFFMETAALSHQNLKSSYKGAVIFGNSGLEPKTEPWHSIVRLKGSGFYVFYLEDLIRDLSKKNPSHPLVAVFFPYLEESEEKVVKEGKQHYDQIQNSSLPDSTKEVLSGVFLNWMLIRFGTENIKEVMKMLSINTPLEETVSYKEIYAIGNEDGEIKGEVKLLKQLYQEGVLTEEVFQSRLEPLEKKLEVILNQEKKES